MARVDPFGAFNAIYGGAVGRFVESNEDRPRQRPRSDPRYNPNVLSGEARVLRDRLAPRFQDVESRYELPEGLLERVAFQESSFRPRTNASSGATGLMQIMPGVHREELAELGLDPNNPEHAIEFAGRYLNRLHKRFGRWDHALAAYNAGQGNVVKYGGTPPFPETNKYVDNIWGDYTEPTRSAEPTIGADTSIVDQRQRMTPVADVTRVAQPPMQRISPPETSLPQLDSFSRGTSGAMTMAEWMLRRSSFLP